MRKRILSSVMAVLLLVILASAAQPAAAATGSIDSASLCGTTVVATFTVTGTTDDGGGNDQVTLEVLDDGAIVAAQDYFVPVGETRSYCFSVTLSSVGQVIPGVGVYLYDGESELDYRDPLTTCIPSLVCEQPVCKTTIGFTSADPAPLSGYVAFYTHFGGLFRPEGWQVGNVSTVAGERTIGSVEVACDVRVRAWVFDQDSDVVGLVPSQYENGDGAFVAPDEDYGAAQGAEPDYYGRYGDIFPPTD